MQTILIDEFHLQVRAPRTLDEAAFTAIRHALDDQRFQANLRRAIRGVFQEFPALVGARAKLSR